MKTIDDIYTRMKKIAIIRELSNGKYRVESEKGRNMGTYDSRSKAEKRLKQIEMFKHMKKRNKKSNKELNDLYSYFNKHGEEDFFCCINELLKNANSDILSYSSIMRDLRKEDVKIKQLFQETFKKSGDQAMNDNIKNPEEYALMQGLKAIEGNIA